MSDQTPTNAPLLARPTMTPAARLKSRRRLVSVLGALDGAQPGSRCFTVTVDQGVSLPCVLVAGEATSLHPFLGKRVMVSGRGVWNVAGEFLRIEADGISDGEGASPGFSQVPLMPAEIADVPPEVLSPPSPGLESYFGLFADDLTDEEALAVLKRMG